MALLGDSAIKHLDVGEPNTIVIVININVTTRHNFISFFCWSFLSSFVVRFQWFHTPKRQPTLATLLLQILQQPATRRHHHDAPKDHKRNQQPQKQCNYIPHQNQPIIINIPFLPSFHFPFPSPSPSLPYPIHFFQSFLPFPIPSFPSLTHGYRLKNDPAALPAVPRSFISNKSSAASL
eukprot:TRINITY_DN3145_c0_g1_i1.p1 TRINITY_DN3145_c0_g1~~TRINITY_DN3145_c0_g1_i1.p1  ORF type:complete len:197 (+),score=8.65 TRINITY_DN3145_c0_g1_i1:55-591(+)